nr:Gfo/Idh/MocA family oxidoreductase [Actinopolymorpha pittospori]
MVEGGAVDAGLSTPKTSFGVVGSGWRAEFYLRIAAALPDRFAVTGVVARRPERAKELRERWDVPTFASLEDLLGAGAPDFAVTSLPWATNPEVVVDLAGRGIPVLSETPPAPDLPGMRALWDAVGDTAIVEVAEQYPFLPEYAARIAVCRSGLLGRVTSAHLSATQTYHAIAVLRRLLGVGFADAEVAGTAFTNRVQRGPGRDGWPTREELVDLGQVIATLDFGDQLAVYDFTDGQWFHPILGNRILVRGERGEVIDDKLTYLSDPGTPVQTTFTRQQTGLLADLEGFHLRTLYAGERQVFTNPYAPARLADEEIAIATCMSRLADRIAGGEGGYSLADACQDHYLGLTVREAVETGTRIRTTRQPWAHD